MCKLQNNASWFVLALNSFAKLQELSVSRLEKIPGAGFKASITTFFFYIFLAG
jgi:hypothetical protein